MSTALVKKNASVTDLVDAQKFAQICMQSGLFKDTTDLAKALLKISYGRALGIDEATAMSSINIISGKLSLSGNLIAVRIKQSGKYRYEVIEKNEKKCSIQFFERIEKYLPDGRLIYEWIKPGPPEVFTFEMAKRANLTRNPVWASHPEAMCFNRALTAGAKTYTPDVFVGFPVYSPDELDPDLPIRVIDGEVVVDATVVDPPPSPKAVAVIEAEVSKAKVLTPTSVSAPTSLEEFNQLAKDLQLDLPKFLAVYAVKTVEELEAKGKLDHAVKTLRTRAAATTK